jgi:ABC-type transport system involved in multi-copper enzyme maturation permease subunit
VNGALAVSRYTLVEISRRRLLLVFFAIGAVGIGGLGIVLKAFTSAFVPGGSGGPGYQGPTPAQWEKLTELQFVTNLIGALGVFALLIAFAIGMTAIYHDLESGAAVAIFSKPVSRFAFTVGKVLAAAVAMIAIVGLLSLEARLVMFLFGGGLEAALWFETLAGVANAAALMLLVLALSAWMNNIVAAVVAFIYNGVAGVVTALHQQLVSGSFGDNQVLHTGLNIAYWLVPHPLVSSAPREIVRQEFEIFAASQPPDAPPVDQIVSSIPGPSSATDILWWVFVVCVLFAILYFAVRRRQV